MKKIAIHGIIVLLLAGVFAGCSNSPGPELGNTWQKGLTDLVVNKGDNSGEITYSFSVTDPAADVYTLYYIEGANSNAAQIIANGTSMPANAGSPGTITGLKNGTIYSIVVVAKKADFTDTVSNIGQAITSKLEGEITWRKFETITERFDAFMGPKYHSSMSAIASVNVRSEAEAVLVSNADGVSLVYTEKTVFVPSGIQLVTFGLAWGPMQRRYPIEMWIELRERTDEGIREWIKGGNCECYRKQTTDPQVYKDPSCDITHAHNDIQEDLIWIVEDGLAGQGFADGWGVPTAIDYHVGGGAQLRLLPPSSNTYTMTITIPLDDYFNNTAFFMLNGSNNDLWAKIAFNPVVSDILKTSKFFKSDEFTMQQQ